MTMDINTLQIVGCVTMQPRRASTKAGNGLTEIEIESLNGQDRNGNNIVSIVRFTLWDAQGGEMYANLQVGQMLLVCGSLRGEIRQSSKGGSFVHLELKPTSVTILPQTRQPISVSVPQQQPPQQPQGQGQFGGGYGFGFGH